MAAAGGLIASEFAPKFLPEQTVAGPFGIFLIVVLGVFAGAAVGLSLSTLIETLGNKSDSKD